MKKLLLSILCLGSLCFALPQLAWSASLNVNLSTGSFTSTNAGGTLASVWTSTSTTPQLTLSCSVNNMAANGTDIKLNTVNSGVYTLSIGTGYRITGYSFSFTNNISALNMTVTPAAGGSAVTCTGSNTATVTASGISLQSTKFTVSATSASAINTSNFVVYYEPITAITVSKSTGTLSGTSDYINYGTWTSTASPTLTLACNVRNISKDADSTRLVLKYTNTNHAGGFFFTVPQGYLISGYTFSFTNSNTSNNMTVTPQNGTSVTCAGSGTATVTVTGVASRSAFFKISPATQADANILVSSITVNIISGTVASNAQALFTTASSGTERYRIPALTQLNNGSLLAINDNRIVAGDIGASTHIDLVGRISSDNGSSWGTQFIILNGSGTSGQDDCAYSDAAVVTDRTSGKIMVMCASGAVGIGSSTRTAPIRITRTYSSNNGVTWDAATDMTEAIYGIFDSRTTAGGVAGIFVTSGKIMQSRVIKTGSYYRLYAALCVRETSAATISNFVIYSDDFGASWRCLGDINTSCAASGNEATCEEMPNGNVVLCSRKQGGRFYNIFGYSNRTTATGSWKTVVSSSTAVDGIIVGGNNQTNGAILRIKATRVSDSKVVRLMLISLPWGYSRTDVSIYYRELNSADYATPATFAAGWSMPYRVSLTLSAYSNMAMQSNGKLALIYEETSQNSGYNTMYQALDISTLTGGKYTYAGEDVPYDLTFFENGTQTSAITVIDNEPIGTCMAADATPPTGYTFGGWNTNATYANSMTAPAYVTTATVPTANTSLYAVYNASGANYTTRYIPVTVTDLGYATFCNSYDVAIPSGVEAYYGVYYGGTNPRVSMKPVSTMIPAGKGVILKNQGTYIFPATDLTTATDFTSNALVGYTTATAVSGSSDLIYYKLSYAGTDKSTVGFYYAGESAHAGFTSVAGRAYLKVSNSTPNPIQSLRMTFNEDPTSIDEITTGSTTGQRVIYDLAGRRVTNPVKGIYIVNGKKMFIK